MRWPGLGFWVKFSVSFTLLLFLIFTIEWQQVWVSLRQARLDLVLLGYVLALGILFLQAWRWKVLLNIPELPITKYLHFIFVGIFYRFFLPGSMSADILKMILFGKKYDKSLHDSSPVFLSQFLGLGMQWVAGLVGLIYYNDLLLQVFREAEWSWKKQIITIIIGVGFIAILFLVPAFRAFLSKVKEAMKKSLTTPGLVSRVFWITLGIQILMIGSAYSIFWGVGVEIPLLFLCLQMAIVNSVLILPISINGIGVVEYLNILFIQNTLGYPAHQIIAVSAVSYSLLVVNALIGGSWILWRNLGSAKQG